MALIRCEHSVSIVDLVTHERLEMSKLRCRHVCWSQAIAPKDKNSGRSKIDFEYLSIDGGALGLAHGQSKTKVGLPSAKGFFRHPEVGLIVYSESATQIENLKPIDWRYLTHTQTKVLLVKDQKVRVWPSALTLDTGMLCEFFSTTESDLFFTYNDRVLKVFCLKTAKLLQTQTFDLQFRLTAMQITEKYLVIATSDKFMRKELLVDIMRSNAAPP